MRKAIALSLLAVFLLTASVMAETPFKINNIGYSADSINKDGSIYVPIRFVAEALGLSVEWVNGEVRIKEVITRPPIYGDEKFVSTVNSALDLLEKKSPADYIMVCNYTEKIFINTPVIKEGFTAYGFSNGTTIAFTKDFLASEFYDAYFMAGVLVHEGNHNVWYRLRMGDDKNLNETIAYTKEIAALKLVGAPQKHIDMAEKQLKRFQ